MASNRAFADLSVRVFDVLDEPTAITGSAIFRDVSALPEHASSATSDA